MHLDIQSAGMVSVLTLPEHPTRHYAFLLKTYLRRSLDGAGRLIVDCEQVTAVDPLCVKVLCSAYRLSRMVHRDFVVAGQRSEPFLRAVKDAEYAHCVACDVASAEGCLWGMR